MKHPLLTHILNSMIGWLMRESPPEKMFLSDFERIQTVAKPGDVLLFSGRSRVAEVIKIVTQSAWSHAALYIGTIDNIGNPVLRERALEFYKASRDEHLLIESELGKGTVITPLYNYRNDHTRICRPSTLSPADAEQVIGYAIGKLGTDYDVRQVLDLFRFAIPWGIFPRRWRSSIFETNAGSQTRVVCTSMLAEAFMAVNYPILPVVQKTQSSRGFELIKRNPKLYVPKDFDYSPFFDIVKYPFFECMEMGGYRTLPWNETWVSQDDGIIQTEHGLIDLNEKSATDRTQSDSHNPENTGPDKNRSFFE